MRRGSLVLLILYAVATVMPSLHHLVLSGDTACESCQVAGGDAPALLADCNGPCGDPTHHHHHGSHDAAQCPACQRTTLFPAQVFAWDSAWFCEREQLLLGVISQPPASRGDVRLNRTRAPPVVSIL